MIIDSSVIVKLILREPGRLRIRGLEGSRHTWRRAINPGHSATRNPKRNMEAPQTSKRYRRTSISRSDKGCTKTMEYTPNLRN